MDVIASIENKKRVPLEKFLFALGIRHVGEETALLIANNLKGEKWEAKGIQDVLRVFPTITIEAWQRIKGIGIKSAEALVEWWQTPANLEMLDYGTNLFRLQCQSACQGCLQSLCSGGSYG